MVVYSAAVEAGILPSVFQRPSVYTPGLTAAPVWDQLETPPLQVTEEEQETIVNAIIYGGIHLMTTCHSPVIHLSFTCRFVRGDGRR